MNELVMPNQYVELTNEEMMYLEGSGFFKKAWKSAKKFAKKVVAVAVKIKTAYDTAKGLSNLITSS